MTDITPRQHKIEDGNTTSDYVKVSLGNTGSNDILHKPLGLSLPVNPNFNEFLVSRSAELANRHLVTRVVQCTSISKSICNQLIFMPCIQHARSIRPQTPHY